MFISHKNNVIQQVHDTEWQCRRITKGMSKPEYWVWIDSITTDAVADYSGETGYTIVECTDEDVRARLAQLDDYVSNTLEGTTYNIKYYAPKKDSEIDGVKSHFIGDDTAKDARLLADKWESVRKQRNYKLAETDYLALGDNTLSAAMKTYRSKLRSVPQDNSDPDDKTWPTKP